jgi:hypothetical protein
MSDLHGKLLAARESHRHILSDIAEALADAEQRHAEERRSIERQLADLAIRLDAAQRERDAAIRHSRHAYVQWDGDRVLAERWRGVLPLLRALTAYVATDGASFTPVRESVAAAYKAGALDDIGEEAPGNIDYAIGEAFVALPQGIRDSIDIPEPRAALASYTPGELLRMLDRDEAHS